MMKEFIKKLLGSGTGISSKRFIAILFAFVFIGVIITHLFGVYVSDTIIWAMVSIITGSAGMSTIDKFSNQKNDNNYEG